MSLLVESVCTQHLQPVVLLLLEACLEHQDVVKEEIEVRFASVEEALFQDCSEHYLDNHIIVKR